MVDNQVCNFWKEACRINSNKCRMARTINGVMGESDICELYPKKYKCLYSRVSYNCTELSLVKEKITYGINTSCS